MTRSGFLKIFDSIDWEWATLTVMSNEVSFEPALDLAAIKRRAKNRIRKQNAVFLLGCVLFVAAFFSLHYAANDFDHNLTVPLEPRKRYDFNSTRVFEHLSLFQGPREWGQEGWEAARQFILEQIPQTPDVSGIEVNVHQITSTGVSEQLLKGHYTAYTAIPVVYVTVHDPALNPACEDVLMYSAHWDGNYAGPGTSDDLAGIMAMLEVLNTVVSSGPQFIGTNALGFAFLGSEETGLEGSDAFIHTDHADRVSAVVNLEAMGGGGKPNLASMSPGTASLLPFDRLTLGSPMVGAGLYHDVFMAGVISPTTDSVNYRYAGLPSIDLVFLKDSFIYHTRDDNIEHTSPADLNSLGQTMLAIAEQHGSATRATTGHGTSTVTYVTVFGALLAIPWNETRAAIFIVVIVNVIGIMRHGPSRAVVAAMQMAALGVGAVAVTVLLIYPASFAAHLASYQRVPMIMTAVGLIHLLSGSIIYRMISRQSVASMALARHYGALALAVIALALARVNAHSTIIPIIAAVLLTLGSVPGLGLLSALTALACVGDVIARFVPILDVIALYNEAADPAVIAILSIGLAPCMVVLAATVTGPSTKLALLLIAACLCAIFVPVMPYSAARPASVLVGHISTPDGDEKVQICTMRPHDIEILEATIKSAGYDTVTGPCDLALKNATGVTLMGAARPTGFHPATMTHTKVDSGHLLTIDSSTTTASNSRWILKITPDMDGEIIVSTDPGRIIHAEARSTIEIFHQGAPGLAQVTFTGPGALSVWFGHKASDVPDDVQVVMGRLPNWVRPFAAHSLAPDGVVRTV
ncbi:Peptidase family M28 [Carpediemonas membranifera]|uniref:Peptidase family M28 n=1 Tax=Carpediemonas membranifera TaxID=201153 RepID=A0A8J6BEI1_9EUKA|nr:Peptidase family M28 [Carpediemonas membranifera]|eukprot:KAG9395787.1 Peptidase family M28 [Carpediemonas membranifera]